MTDVAIIGGSVAGIQTALNLKKEGINSTVIEEHPEIGKPVHCSGLISKTGVEEAGLLEAVEESTVNKVKGARIYSPYNSVIELKKPGFAAYVVDRALLDKKLYYKAKLEGIEFKLNSKLISRRNDTLFLKVMNRGEIVKTKLIVGADGPHSTVREMMNVKFPSNGFIHTYQARMHNHFDPDFVELHFGEFAKGFFAWIIPESNETARVGIGVDFGINPQKRFEWFIQRRKLEGRISNDESALIPCHAPLKNIVKDDMLLVGDAAWQTKATSGGGLIFASLAAKLASQAIREHLINKAPLADYEKLCQKTINPELELHWKLRRYLNSMNEDRFDALLKKLKDSGIEKILEEHGDMDKPSRFVKKITRNPRFLGLLPEAIKFGFA